MKSTDILRVENLQNDGKTYVIQWQVTYLCNYCCNFCVQGDREFRSQQSKKESAQTRETICRNLIALLEGQLNGKAETVQIILLGGEVTIMKDFLPIFSRLLEAKFDGLLKIHITTNLSTDIKTCRAIVDMFRGRKNRKLSMSCSYYKEFANEKEFFKKVGILTGRSNCRKIMKRIFHSNRKWFSCTIGYPLCRDEDYEEYMKFMQRHAKYADLMKELVIRDYKTCITKNVKDKLLDMKKPKKKIRVTYKDGTTRYFGHNLDIALPLDEICFSPHGFWCDSGVHFLNIDPQGNMSRCITAARETTFGNICSDPPQFLGERMRCPAKRCACSYYSLIENDLE